MVRYAERVARRSENRVAETSEGGPDRAIRAMDEAHNSRAKSTCGSSQEGRADEGQSSGCRAQTPTATTTAARARSDAGGGVGRSLMGPPALCNAECKSIYFATQSYEQITTDESHPHDGDSRVRVRPLGGQGRFNGR